jgi:putative sterol carrier protein
MEGYRKQHKKLTEQVAAKAISFEEGSDQIQLAIFDEFQDAFETWQSKGKPSAPKAVAKKPGEVKRSGKAEVIARMEKINRSEKSKEKMKKWAKKKPKIVQFILEGESNPFYCVFEQDKVNVIEGTYEKNADVIFETDTETWARIQSGELEGFQAYYDGIYMIRGSGTKKFDDAKTYSDICWESHKDLNE